MKITGERKELREEIKTTFKQALSERTKTLLFLLLFIVIIKIPEALRLVDLSLFKDDHTLAELFKFEIKGTVQTHTSIFLHKLIAFEISFH